MFLLLCNDSNRFIRIRLISSAKIYGYRVDALHTDTQKLSGNIINEDDNSTNDHASSCGNVIDYEQVEIKKVVRRQRNKCTSHIVTDPSKITLDYAFDFRPLQSSSLCQWRGGIGEDSIYADMVSNTMYSTSDYSSFDAFINGQSTTDEYEQHVNNVLDRTQTTIIDLIHLRQSMKSMTGSDHLLGSYRCEYYR
jgi:hypothetical protein